jgi:tight adherence protein C
MAPEILLVVVGVFTVVAALTALLFFVALERVSPERRRLQQFVGGQFVSGDPQPSESSLVVEGPSAAERTVGRYVPKSPKEVARIRRMLMRAGYRSYWAVVVYAAAEVLLPLMFAAVPIVVMGPRRGFIFAVLLGALGFAIPGLVLGRLVYNYKKQIRNGLPDALDLLIVCLEAGSGLDQAILKASEELQVSYPSLAEELRLITTEIRAGKPRLEAFKNFAERTKVEDVQTLVAMLVQTDRFGTSVSQALRTHAETARTKRRQRAEEKAAKLGVKLVFPLVFFLFPALYTVTLGPAVIQFARLFFPAISNR